MTNTTATATINNNTVSLCNKLTDIKAYVYSVTDTINTKSLKEYCQARDIQCPRLTSKANWLALIDLLVAHADKVAEAFATARDYGVDYEVELEKAVDAATAGDRVTNNPTYIESDAEKVQAIIEGGNLETVRLDYSEVNKVYCTNSALHIGAVYRSYDELVALFSVHPLLDGDKLYRPENQPELANNIVRYARAMKTIQGKPAINQVVQYVRQTRHSEYHTVGYVARKYPTAIAASQQPKVRKVRKSTLALIKSLTLRVHVAA